ncbi:hypothetical protein OH781_05825 [Streptomyces sp. NBC_01550]|uniref:hypothetical protein n=1 Tax=Streptomyces sp. NBC_01550 TaxID=2975875 RepID=UPI00348E4C9B
MALRMEWSIVGPFSGLAGQSVRDVEDAVWWVNDTVTQIREYANLTPFESEQLGESARLMCARMLDEADSATSRGEQWSATVGLISMTLTPIV